MNELKESIKKQEIEYIQKSKMFFNKWIESGDSIYREKEFHYVGAAWACLRILNQIEVTNEGV